MKNSEEFYNKTKGGSPSGLLRLFFSMNYSKDINGNIAIDLGAGAGNDARYLVEKGFKVTCIDKEEKAKGIIMSQNNESLKFELQEFENLKLNKANLINACFSLFFCNPDRFEKMMIEITSSIKEKGFFVGNFLGREDEWKTNNEMTFLNKEELLNYFNDFKIMYFAEKKYIKDTVLGKEDEWKGNNQETFLNKEELLNYFKDFKIMYFAEKKYIKDTILGKTKNWHVFEIIAMKE